MSCHAQNYPAGYSMFMIASLLYDNPPEHIVVVPKRSSDLEKLPNRLSLLVNVVIEAQSGKYPLLNDRTTFYVCKGHTCYPPVNMLYGDLTSFPFPQ